MEEPQLTKNHVPTLESEERSKLWIGGTQPKKERSTRYDGAIKSRRDSGNGKQFNERKN